MIDSERIGKLIAQVECKLISFLKKKEDKRFLVDPVEHRVISTHYGQTHCCAGLIIKGLQENDKELYKVGIDLLNGILSTWDVDKKQSDFHNDFNNFALCIVWEKIHAIEPSLSALIKVTILSTDDSKHNTVNWLPMRMLVCFYRYVWTNDEVYIKRYQALKKVIRKATYEDGFIEDRLPKGTSYNLQYNVATVATLGLVNELVDDKIDLVQEITALLYASLEDGDINYLGRGCNQIFAWGPFMYLLAGTNEHVVSTKALSYLESHLLVTLENNNIFLNCDQGSDRAWWWDYHYSSVYIAHLYLWLVLAIQQKPHITPSKQPLIHDSSVELIRKNGWTVVCFAGRKEYLAEAGPTIQAIWNEKCGVIFKGCFGPYLDQFGLKYSNYHLTMMNYIGIQQVKIMKTGICSRVLRKIGVNIVSNHKQFMIPIFADFDINVNREFLILRYRLKKSLASRFVATVNNEIFDLRIAFSADGGNTWRDPASSTKFANQYGTRKHLISAIENTSVWMIKLYVQE